MMNLAPCSNSSCSNSECCYEGYCVERLGEGKSCILDECCDQGLECNNLTCSCPLYSFNTNVLSCNGQTAIFITASQIALSIALLMGLAALVMVMYRLCTKPKYLRRQHLAEQDFQNLDRSYASFLRTSLSSVQIRVLTRLRDRPPCYDNRILASPPDYDSISANTHQPPPYAELILSPVGYLNEGYSEDASANTGITISSRNVNNAESSSTTSQSTVTIKPQDLDNK